MAALSFPAINFCVASVVRLDIPDGKTSQRPCIRGQVLFRAVSPTKPDSVSFHLTLPTLGFQTLATIRDKTHRVRGTSKILEATTQRVMIVFRLSGIHPPLLPLAPSTNAQKTMHAPYVHLWP